MSWRIPDGVLDDTHAWNNENDRIEFLKAFQSNSAEEQKMAVALMSADPSTPERDIRRNLSVAPGTNRPWSEVDRSEPTLNDAWTVSGNGSDLGTSAWDVNR